MASQETLQTDTAQLLSEQYASLNPTIDPLEIAAAAIVKLRENGLSGYIPPTYSELAPSETAEIIIHPSSLKEMSAPPRKQNIENLPKPRLTDAEQRKLVVKAKEGDATALEKVWLDAQGLAGHIAMGSESDWLLEDKVQTCLEVVPGAVERYDPSRKTTFSTFLYKRMEGALIDEERAYTRSHGLGRHGYRQLQDALQSDNPNAALHELTQPLKTKDGTTRRGFFMAPNLVSELGVSPYQTSLEELVYTSDDGNTDKSFEPAGSQCVFEEAAQNINREKLSEIIELLPETQRHVITSYYGLFDTPPITMREIGESMGVTESRISQLHVVATDSLAKILGKNDLLNIA